MVFLGKMNAGIEVTCLVKCYLELSSVIETVSETTRGILIRFMNKCC